MDFTGRIFFNFETYDVWRIYTTVLKASQDRSIRINVTWEEFLVEDPDLEAELDPKTRALAACAAVRHAYPQHHQRFVQTLLTLVYQEKDDPRRDTTYAVAAKVAGLDTASVLDLVDGPGLEQLVTDSEEIRALGVSDVPTIIDDGPPLLIKTTGAANYGNSIGRLGLINTMMRDDGIWSLTKPSGG